MTSVRTRTINRRPNSALKDRACGLYPLGQAIREQPGRATVTLLRTAGADPLCVEPLPERLMPVPLCVTGWRTHRTPPAVTSAQLGKVGRDALAGNMSKLPRGTFARRFAVATGAFRAEHGPVDTLPALTVGWLLALAYPTAPDDPDLVIEWTDTISDALPAGQLLTLAAAAPRDRDLRWLAAQAEHAGLLGLPDEEPAPLGTTMFDPYGPNRRLVPGIDRDLIIVSGDADTRVDLIPEELRTFADELEAHVTQGQAQAQAEEGTGTGEGGVVPSAAELDDPHAHLEQLLEHHTGHDTGDTTVTSHRTPDDPWHPLAAHYCHLVAGPPDNPDYLLRYDTAEQWLTSQTRNPDQLNGPEVLATIAALAANNHPAAARTLWSLTFARASHHRQAHWIANTIDHYQLHDLFPTGHTPTADTLPHDLARIAQALTRNPPDPAHPLPPT